MTKNIQKDCYIKYKKTPIRFTKYLNSKLMG